MESQQDNLVKHFANNSIITPKDAVSEAIRMGLTNTVINIVCAYPELIKEDYIVNYIVRNKFCAIQYLSDRFNPPISFYEQVMVMGLNRLSVEAVQFALSKGVNPNGKHNGVTYLCNLFLHPSDDVIPIADLLIQSGGDLNNKSIAGGYFGFGSSTIFAAIASRKMSNVEYVVASGADLKIKTGCGMLPHQLADKHGLNDISEYIKNSYNKE